MTDHRYRAGEGPAQISPSLTKAWRDIDVQSVYFAEEIAGSDLETDLILIGGPKTNALTARLSRRGSGSAPGRV